MLLQEPFLMHVLDKHTVPGVTMLITDVSGRVIASTDQSRIGARSQEAEFILRTGHSATIDHEKTAGYGQSLSAMITFACLLSYNDESFGSLVCIGERETAMSLSAQVKSALETAAAYHDYSQAMLTKTDDRAWLARALLEESMNEPRIRATMNRIEMDASLMRAVICVSMQHHQPSYFNINLNLGYQSSVERINERIVEKIRQSRFMNTQDLTLVYDRNTLVIIKSFLLGSSVTRAYLSLDVICKDIAGILDEYTGFSYHVAYGNLYPGLRDIRQSFVEATQMIEVGIKTHPQGNIYALDTLMFDAICAHLQPQIINKVILPTLEALSAPGEELPGDVLQTANDFVDNCMSISKTAENTYIHRNTVRLRLEKLRRATSLNPSASFRDAFLVKMAATYIKLQGRRSAAGTERA